MNHKLTIGKIIYNKFYLCIVSLIVLLSTCYLEFMSPMDGAISILAYALCAINFLLFFICSKYDKFSISLLVFGFFLLISSVLLNDDGIVGFLKYYFNIISYILFLNLNIKKDAKGTFSILNSVFFILIFINFMTILICPKGMYTTIRYSNNWFFKYDNTHIFMYLPGLCVALLNTKFNKKISAKLLCIVEFLIITYCVFYCQSTNSMVGYAIIIIYFLFRRMINKMSWLNSVAYFFTFIAIFVLVVALREQGVFNTLIGSFLNKTSTLTGRTHIWTETIKLILKKPIFGYGVSSSSLLVELLNNNRYTHAHNTFLDVLFKGGVLSFIPFISMILFCVKENFKMRKDVVAKTLSIFLFSAFIMMNFEAREEKIGFYILLLIVFNTKEIITQLRKEGHLYE